MIVNGCKHCPSCSQDLPTDQFYTIRRKTGDGLAGHCKACASKKAVAWQRANPEADAAIRQRRAEKLKLIKRPMTDEQKEYRNLQSRKNYRENLEHRREIQRKAKQREKDKDPETFRAKHAIQCGRRRCNIKGYPTDMTVQDWRALLERFDRHCPFCNAVPTFFDLDHLIPIHLGGFNVVGNIVPICRPCNAQKSCIDPKRFVTDMKVNLQEILEKIKIRESVYPTCNGTYTI